MGGKLGKESHMRAGRVAAIYDIHGNSPALEAVLAEIAEVKPDLILVGGDVVPGPMPGETLARLMALGERACFIRGNADRELVARYDRLARGADTTDDDAIGRILTWSARQLGGAQRAFLAGFSERIAVEIDGLGPTLFCHGSPRSDEELVTRATPERRLREALSGVAQRVVVCGHTHMQFDRASGDKRAINAGSVGMPYEGRPGAYWALLGPTVDLRRTPYDFERAAAQIRASGYPDAEEFARENVLNPPPVSEGIALFEKAADERAAVWRRRVPCRGAAFLGVSSTRLAPCKLSRTARSARRWPISQSAATPSGPPITR